MIVEFFTVRCLLLTSFHDKFLICNTGRKQTQRLRIKVCFTWSLNMRCVIFLNELICFFFILKSMQENWYVMAQGCMTDPINMKLWGKWKSCQVNRSLICYITIQPSWQTVFSEFGIITLHSKCLMYVIDNSDLLTNCRTNRLPTKNYNHTK